MKKGEKNINLYEKKVTEKEGYNKTVRSRLDANKRYDSTMDALRIRVPKGYNDIIKKYVASSEYSSVNALINELIRDKLISEGIELPDDISD